MLPGELLRLYRERMGQPRYWLAFHVGIREGELRRIERGELEPTKRQRKRLVESVTFGDVHDRNQVLRWDALSDREIDRIVLDCARSGCDYDEIQAALAAARTARLTEHEEHDTVKREAA